MPKHDLYLVKSGAHLTPENANQAVVIQNTIAAITTAQPDTREVWHTIFIKTTPLLK